MRFDKAIEIVLLMRRKASTLKKEKRKKKMRYRVTNATTGEVLETDSLRIAFRTADSWIRQTERNNELPWYIADVTVWDLGKNNFVYFRTKK